MFKNIYVYITIIRHLICTNNISLSSISTPHPNPLLKRNFRTSGPPALTEILRTSRDAAPQKRRRNPRRNRTLCRGHVVGRARLPGLHNGLEDIWP